MICASGSYPTETQVRGFYLSVKHPDESDHCLYVMMDRALTFALSTSFVLDDDGVVAGPCRSDTHDMLAGAFRGS